MALTQVKALGIAADSIDETKLADDSIDSEHYNDGSIDTAHLADDAVTLAKMASGTDGQIITFDASGNPVAVGPGSDGQVLTSTGAGSPPAFEAVPAGGATINNATENELVTVASTTTQLDAETKLTFDGSKLLLAPRGQQTDPRGYLGVKGEDADVVAFVACGFNSVGNTVGYYFTCHDVAAPRRKAGIVLKKTGDYGIGDIEFWIDQTGDDADVAGGDLHTTFENNGDIAINDGNLVVGTSGHGIDFSADGNAGGMTAELLDDYEEGRWDIVANTNLTPDTAYNSWSYTKIGRMCTIRGRLRVSSVSGSDNMSISLPFAVGNMNEHGNSGASPIMYTGIGVTDRHVISLTTFGNASAAVFYGSAYNVGWSVVNNSHLNAGDDMYISHTYFTA